MILSTDSTANLPKEMYKQLNISMVPMKIILEGNTYDDLSESLPIEEYYGKMREGKIPSTAQINEFDAREYFEKLLEQKQDVLHIGFSTALSGSTNTLKRVAEELNSTHQNKIVVVDSLNASCGEGMLVLYAKELIDQGKSIEEVAEMIKEKIPHSKSYFTVEQLKYLVKGGRVGKFSGIIGTILNVKPVLTVDHQGRLVSYKKIISRKKSIAEMVEIVASQIAQDSKVMVAHAMCLSDAEDFAEKVKAKVGVEPLITDLTQVIGCHTGPGLLAVFFFHK